MFSPGIIGYAGGGGGGSDPYFSNVVSLLHFDGADGSTTFTDQKGKTWTVGGNAQIDTAQSKFGGASGLFDGSGDYLEAADSADWDFGSGDFTIECWMRPAVVNIRHTICIKSSLAQVTSWALYLVNTQFEFNASTNDTSWDVVNARLFGTATANTWTHVAVSRSGTNWYYFQDGVQQGATGSASGTLSANTRVVRIGYQGSHSLNGWLDDLRITKGVARYTSNFTPPSAAFPDS